MKNILFDISTKAHLVLLIFGGSFKLGFFDFMKKIGKTSMEVSLRGSKKIDTLFTSFAYVPIIVFKDKFTLFSDDPNMADGYCLRRYEVDLVTKIFMKFSKNMKMIFVKMTTLKICQVHK